MSGKAPAAPSPPVPSPASGRTPAPSRVRRLLGTLFGVGLLPRAPGTWASAATVLLFALLFGVRGVHEPLVSLGPDRAAGGVLAVLGALALLFAAGVWLGHRAPADFGTSDPGAFVLDEVVGQGLALLPLLPGAMSPWRVLAAFALFRVFDIRKPPPCARLERLHGGVGIMADDVMAGLYAAAIVALLPA